MIFSGYLVGSTIYYANKFKRNLKRSETMRMHMQPSVMVVASDDQSQIKTHREARQQDSIEALMELYDTLPVDLSITRTLAKEPRFVYYMDALIYQYLKLYLITPLIYIPIIIYFSSTFPIVSIEDLREYLAFSQP